MKEHLDWILGSNSLIQGGWGTTCSPESYRFPIPGGIQGQIVWDPGQPDLVDGNSVYVKDLELDDLHGPFQSKPFCDSAIFLI